jgi:hypothetical protein
MFKYLESSDILAEVMTKVKGEDLTRIRFELIKKMLEVDPKLRRLVKAYALTHL